MGTPSLKHKKFAQEVVKNGGNGTLAYAKVYPAATKHSAEVSASRLLKNAEVKTEIEDYRQAIARVNGPEAVAKTLKGLLKAKKKIYFEGEHVDTDADHAARNAAVKTVLQSQGVLDSDAHALPQTPTINFNFITAPSAQQLPSSAAPEAP